jgi:succinoglycan biosynthesis protein ExoO
MGYSAQPPVEVSVIIAAYNARRTIRDAVLSALCQQGVSLEILVCDDGSSDGTMQELDEVRDARLRVFRQPVNVGAGASRDFLIAEACGRFLAFLDADDCFEPGRLDRLVRVARASPGTIVFDDIFECHDSVEGLVPFRRVHGNRAFGGCGRDGGPRPVTLSQLVSAPRLLVKALIPRQQLLQSGVRHSHHRYGEDGLFLWSMLARGLPAIYLPEPLYRYRITPGSLSANAERHLLLADCLAALGRESVSDQERRMIQRREKDVRAVARLRAVPLSRPAAKIIAALRYFVGAPDRFPRWVHSQVWRARYSISRRRIGAPGR